MKKEIKVTEGFTVKDMLVRVMDKQDVHEEKLDVFIKELAIIKENVMTLEIDNKDQKEQLEVLNKHYYKTTAVITVVFVLLQVGFKVLF